VKKTAYPTGDMYRQSALRGGPVTHRFGGIEHADKFGTDLAMRPATPPPIAEYDAYLKARNVRVSSTIHTPQKTGYRLRRIVVMRRAGSSWKECGEAVGISGPAAQDWVAFLPYELAV